MKTRCEKKQIKNSLKLPPLVRRLARLGGFDPCTTTTVKPGGETRIVWESLAKSEQQCSVCGGGGGTRIGLGVQRIEEVRLLLLLFGSAGDGVVVSRLSQRSNVAER